MGRPQGTGDSAAERRARLLPAIGVDLIDPLRWNRPPQGETERASPEPGVNRKAAPAGAARPGPED